MIRYFSNNNKDNCLTVYVRIIDHIPTHMYEINDETGAINFITYYNGYVLTETDHNDYVLCWTFSLSESRKWDMCVKEVDAKTFYSNLL
jgi:hypothetical protein